MQSPLLLGRQDRIRSLVLLSSLRGLEYRYDTIFPALKTLGYCQGAQPLNTNSLLGQSAPPSRIAGASASVCLWLERDAEQRCDDSATGDKCSAHRAGNF